MYVKGVERDLTLIVSCVTIELLASLPITAAIFVKLPL